jgi:hypothetical protein
MNRSRMEVEPMFINVRRKHYGGKPLKGILAFGIGLALSASTALCSSGLDSGRSGWVTVSPSSKLMESNAIDETQGKSNIDLLLDHSTDSTGSGVLPVQYPYPGFCNTPMGGCAVDCAFPGSSCACVFLGLGTYYGLCH